MVNRRPEFTDSVARQTLANARIGKGGWLRANCLLCPLIRGDEDKRQSWGYNPVDGMWHCFRCHSSGTILDPYNYVAGELVDAAKKNADEPGEHDRPPEGFHFMEEEPALSSRLVQPARDFLDRRGVTAEKRRLAKIGVCLTGKCSGRIIIPLLTGDGTAWLGWIGRSWKKKSRLPYLYPRGMDRGGLLYCVNSDGQAFHNGHVLYRETDEPLYIVEGAFDSMAFWPDDCGAVLGKPSSWQISLLGTSLRRPVVVVLDGDATFEAWALVAQLQAAARVKGQRARYAAVRLPPTADPDELDMNEIRAAAQLALNT